MSNTDRHPECHMRTALGNCDPIGGFCTSVNEPICEALHRLYKPQGDWIPCSERLPELGETVLTFDGNCISVERRIEWINTPEGQLDGEWWIDGYDGDEYNPINLRDGTAIAWMPLPEPWKETEVE